MDASTPIKSRKSMLSFSRTDSIRLHGFQQKRAVRRGGLKTVEMSYLQAAADGDIKHVEKLFKKYTKEQLNRNCTDVFDRTSLVLSILNRHEEMVKFLLENRVDLTESLYYAIETEFTEAVEEILRSEAAEKMRHREMLITSEESVFPMFLSPITLAGHKNNYEILEILYSYGHRLMDFSLSATNKWDQMRLRWLYCKARASQAYMILKYNKERIDPLNEAIEFFALLKGEGLKSREVRESYTELAKQCEEFAIALLDQVRTAQELADILRFRLVDLENAKERLVISTLPVLVAQARPTPMNASAESVNSGLMLSPHIKITEATNASDSWPPNGQGRIGHSPDRRELEQISSGSDKQFKTASLDSETRRLSAVIDHIPDERKRTLGIRRPVLEVVEPEHARPIHFLKPIEKAVDAGMVRLVTCENSQIALAYLKDGRLFRNVPAVKQFFLKLLVAMMFPFISVAFYVWPTSKFGLLARNPTAKLWMEVASDIALILILVLHILLNEFRILKEDEFSPLLIIAYFWMPGKFLNLCFLWYHQGSRVFYSIWNWNDIGSILSYTLFMILRATASIYNHSSQPKDQWALVPLSDMMMCTVFILVFLRPLEILRVNRTFGPMQISLDRMMKDVIKFFLLFLVMWFAFSCGINILFWRYRPATTSNGTSKCDWTVNMTLQNPDDFQHAVCCSEKDKFTNLGSSLQVHFWSIFGYSDDYDTWFDLTCHDDASRMVTSKVGEIFFALYHIGTVLVMVNMLIAIMSGTLQKTLDDSDIQWQFHRTRVWIRFIRTGFYRPPPMNILPRPKEVWFVCKIIWKHMKTISRSCSRRFTGRRSGGHSETHEMDVRLAARRQLNATRSFDDSRSASSVEGVGDSYSSPFRSGFLPRSVSNVRADEVLSTYDITLKKCVRRYIKTHVMQTENMAFVG